MINDVNSARHRVIGAALRVTLADWQSGESSLDLAHDELDNALRAYVNAHNAEHDHSATTPATDLELRPLYLDSIVWNVGCTHEDGSVRDYLVVARTHHEARARTWMVAELLGEPMERGPWRISNSPNRTCRNYTAQVNGGRERRTDG